jgi:pyridoxamine 5'-phosphate oxidase
VPAHPCTVQFPDLNREICCATVNIANLRHEYMQAGLEERHAAADPIEQFARWFNETIASGLHLPTAVILATADARGAPSARTVLLKGYDRNGFVFYTNYASRKGRELAANPNACLLFSWEELERQVRIEGPVERVPAAESDEYFASRPLGSRLGAWASPQSETVADRAVLEARFADAQRRYGEAVPRPPHWGGYRVVPSAIEFWQGRENRLHDRLRYRRDSVHGDGARWTIERLAP